MDRPKELTRLPLDDAPAYVIDSGPIVPKGEGTIPWCVVLAAVFHAGRETRPVEYVVWDLTERDGKLALSTGGYYRHLPDADSEFQDRVERSRRERLRVLAHEAYVAGRDEETIDALTRR